MQKFLILSVRHFNFKCLVIGGIAVSQDNSLQVGDVVPVHITYGDLDIEADVKIVTAGNNKAGGQFVNLDQATANKLLYLNLLLEDAEYSITLK